MFDIASIVVWRGIITRFGHIKHLVEDEKVRYATYGEISVYLYKQY